MTIRVFALIFGLSAVSLGAFANDLGINVVLEGELQPGVYGRVELGRNARPDVYYPEPVVIVEEPRYVNYEPVYLHVPPGHARNWGKHCHRYHACERRVYFVRSVEYQEGYYEDDGHHRDHGHHHKKHHHGKGKKHHHHH